MSFLSNLVRPSIKTATKREVAANVWEKCPACQGLVYEADLPNNLFCCTHCNHHLQWNITARLAHLLDDNSQKPIPVPATADDPLKFKDRKKYSERLKEARAETNNPDAYRVVEGTINGLKIAVFAMDFAFMAGSMSRAVGSAFVAAAQHAVKHRLPLLAITASGGARMQESTLSLMQMARTTAAVAQLKEAKLPYLVLLTHPTTGGTTASFAMQGDIHIAEPQALIGFAGPRVIEQTIRQTLPEGFQKAEYLLAHGMIDLITPRKDQKQKIHQILTLLLKKESSPKV
ncbi:MAG: acetyl-CoA carboxylase carboxyltransferase subunit beta [Proteobacteria bacterium]|nr:acetyl-CoA carboxylase carboxyltransferase subunit beta [Pseudomonadota bacterium]NBX86244.1 acetyl-CoA carboxylase carboxyltransferase subunit beta [Pseudomonadota bacterium]